MLLGHFRRRWWPTVSVVLLLVLWACVVLLIRLDPGGILDWYFD